MATTVEELRVKVTADTAAAEKGLDRVDDKAAQSGKGFSAAKTAVVGFAGAGATAIAGKLIMAASDLNETVSKTGVVFGDQTEQVTGYAQQMADKFGLPKTAVLDAASSFGLLGQAAGLSGKPLATMSTDLAGLAADAMSFYNVPLEQALGDFTSALSGESEPVKKYGVLMNEAAVNAEALALGLAKPVVNMKALGQAEMAAMVAKDKYTKAVQKFGHGSIEAAAAQVAMFKAQDKVKEAAKGVVGPLTEAQKVQARTSLLTKGLSKAQGDLARTSDSVSNRTKMLQGRIQNMAADMGTKLLPAAGAVLGSLLSLLDALPRMVGWLKENGKTIGIVAGVITAILLPSLIQWGVQSTIAAAKSVAAWVASSASAVASGWVTIGSMLRVVAGWVMMGAAAVKSAAQTVAIWALYKVEAIKGAAAHAVSAARVVGGWVLMGVQSMIQAARMAAAWFIALGPVGWVIAAVIALVALVIANWDTVVKATKAAWSAVTGWLKQAWAWIKSASAAALAFLVNLVTLQFRIILGIAKTVWNGIKAAISAALGFIKAVITTYVNTYRAVITGAWNAIKSVTSSAWNGIKSVVSGAIGGLISVVRSIPGKIMGALGNLGGLLRQSGERIMQGLADGIRAGLGRVTSAVKGVLQKARNLLPFSPAKTGPFSGRGWTLYSGRSISAALAKGMTQNLSMVRKSALGMAEAAVPRIGNVTGPGVTPGGMGGSRASGDLRGGLRPSQMANGPRQGPTVQVDQRIYYPVAEKTTTATNRGLQRVAALPIGG